MLRPTVPLLIFACLFLGTLSGEANPFVGKWELNQSKSKMTGEREKIEALGGNKYRITAGQSSEFVDDR